MSSSSSSQPISLADGFAVASENDWRAAVARARRNDPDNDRPVPLVARQAGSRAIIARKAGNSWRIVQRIDADGAADANRLIGEEIAGGASGIALAFADAPGPLAGRLQPELAEAIANALNTAADGFEARIESRDVDALSAFAGHAANARLRLVRAFDPVLAVATDGAPLDPAADIVAAARILDASSVSGIAAIADGRGWHAAGASEAVELSVVLATFVSHLRTLGTPERIGVALATDTDQFHGIAKFRAIRLLLARVAEVADLDRFDVPVHGETAWRAMSRGDTRMNVLRATSGAFAAAVGGADSITVLPFDVLSPEPTESARRLARNTQLILAEEAHVGRVADPAAGSGTIEAMTAALAEEAWRRFQTIEADGGIVAAIREGALLREIAEAREARLASVAACTTRMVGVNAFTSPPVAARPYRRRPVGRVPTLVFKRLAEPFEDAAT